jgi:HAMP domain-containing protein
MTVSVICEECGKVYHIPIAKLDQVKGDVVKTKCKDCGHIIHIQKEEKVHEETQEYDSLEGIEDDDLSTDEFDDEDFDNLERAFQEAAQESIQDESIPEPAAAAPAPKASKKTSKLGMGLRVKMIILFMVIPLLLMTASAFLTQRQLNLLTSDITTESANIVKKMGERSVADIGKAVAAQCKLYLEANPGLKRENFADDPAFAKLAIQKVGKTGYTALSSVGPFTAWVHPNPKLKGVALSNVIKKLLGPNYPQFARIIAQADKGKNVTRSGYYLWKDRDGQMREKFMTLTPIAGTDFNIAATTYIHEFTGPIRALETRSEEFSGSARNLNLITIAGTLVIISLIVTLYGHNLVTKIRHLTNVADRISVGELDAEIKIKSKDEIGSLADAITRMQDSLRLSIERLRKRR